MCLPQGFGLRSRLNICFWKWTASALTSLTFIASRLNSNYTAWQFTYLKNHKGQMHNPLASSAISWVTTVFLPRPEEKTCYNSYPNPISQLLHCIFALMTTRVYSYNSVWMLLPVHTDTLEDSPFPIWSAMWMARVQMQFRFASCEHLEMAQGAPSVPANRNGMGGNVVLNNGAGILGIPPPPSP